MSAFSTLYAEVGNLTPSTGVARDKLFTNQAYKDVCQARRWSWLAASTTVPLVAGTRTYKLLGTTPVVTDFDAPISVVLEVTASGSRKKLPRMDPQFFDDLLGHCSTNSEPIAWTIQGDLAATTSAAVIQGGQQSLVVGPPPIATAGHGVNLIIRYWRSPATVLMTADADLPIVPVQYEDLIIQRACSRAMLAYRLDNTQFQRDYEARLASAMDADMAVYTGDNDTLILQPPIQIPAQSPLTQADRNPNTRPLPAGV